MVGLLHAMAFMVLLLIGWVIWNNKPLPLPLQFYIIFLCCVKYQVPQQQLIYLQIWLSASFCNRYWIAYKYFWFCSMQIYLISLVTFDGIISNNRLFDMGMTLYCTRASRLLHKCHETIHCLRAKAGGCCCLVSINVASGVSLVNIRLLPFSASDNIKFLRYGFT